MKKVMALIIAFICLIAVAAAEGLEDIVPDASIWGISANDLKEKYEADYEQCKVGEDEAWRVSNIEVCSYDMDVYYVFDGKTNTQLSKIAYILNVSDFDDDSALDSCLQTLVEEIKKIEGEPDSIKKTTNIWKKDEYKIELGKGKLEKYTGLENATVAIIFKKVSIPKPTPSPAPACEELSQGSKGEAVKKLQNRLNELGYTVGIVDGDYGNKTKIAIEAFQSLNKLKVTGIADQETQAKLYSKKAIKPTPTPRPTPTPTPKPEYAKLDYKGVSRHPENYNGKLVKFTGIVVQAQETYGVEYSGGSLFDEYYVLRVASKYKKYSYIDGYDTDDIVYVVVPKKKVEGGRILEDDKVSVYGHYDGIETYETILGGSVSIPRVEANRVVIK